MKNNEITKELIQSVAAKEQRTKAIAEAGLTKSQFYLYANLWGVSIKRPSSSYKLSPEDKALINKLVKETDLSYRTIGEKFEVSHTTIKRCVKSHA